MCYCNPLFTLLVLSFAQVIDLLPQGKSTTPIDGLDDITKLDSYTYCKFQANRFKCGNKKTFSYYYNVEKNTCDPFQYGHCQHPYNVFPNLRSCRDECRDMNIYRTFTNLTASIYCRLQPEFGNCNSYFPKYYFDTEEMVCKGFSYSGCGGNQNRFEHSNKCLDTCRPVVQQCKSKKCNF